MRAVVAAVAGAVPVTVKIRAGLREGDEAGRRLAPRLVAAGAAAVCIHPRTAGAAVSRPRRPRGHAALAAELARAGDRLGRRRTAAPPPLALLDAGAAAVMLARPQSAVPGSSARSSTARRRPSLPSGSRKLRRFADEVLVEHGPPRRRPPAPVLAALPAQRRPRQEPRRRRLDAALPARPMSGRCSGSADGRRRGDGLPARRACPILARHSSRGARSRCSPALRVGGRSGGQGDHPHARGLPPSQGRGRLPLDQEA